MDDQVNLSSADEQSATLDPAALLAVIAGRPDPTVSASVRRVLEYAVQERSHEAPLSPEDEVLTLEFQHTFTREQVAQILQALP